MSKNSDLGFRLDKRIEGITRSMNRVTYEAMAMMVIRMDEVSPVGDIKLWKADSAKKAIREGYVGGQFRGNWQLGVNQIPQGWFPGKIDPTGDATVVENLSRIPAMASRGYKFYLVNNTPYGRYLEDGHATLHVAPHGFVLRAKREFNGIVRKIVAQIKSEGGRVK